MAGEHTPGHQSPTTTLTKIDRLQRDRQHRDNQQCFFVEGVRNFVSAVDHNAKFETLIYSERLLTSPIARKLVRRLKRAGVPFICVTPEQFRAVSHAEHASGVGAILRQNMRELPQVSPEHTSCWIALEKVRSLGNLGSLIRSSAAVGAAGFLLLGTSIDPFEPAIIRASMGACFQQSFVRSTREQLREWVARHDLMVVGASPDGTNSYNRLHYPQPTVLMLGEERSGLSSEQRQLCDKLVRIPMQAGTDSLNLAVAGSLLLYAVADSQQTTIQPPEPTSIAEL